MEMGSHVWPGSHRANLGLDPDRGIVPSGGRALAGEELPVARDLEFKRGAGQPAGRT